jgi:phage terminase Nu1 subunit (DNA packaging protein)
MTASPLPETVPIAALAELFGVTPRHVRNLLEGAKVKSTVRGQWPLAEAVKAILAQAREAREPDALAAARARALNARAKAQEIALARQERDLIPLDEAVEVMDEYTATVRELMDSIPARVTRDLELRRKIEAEIRGAHAAITKKFSASTAELRSDTTVKEEAA